MPTQKPIASCHCRAVRIEVRPPILYCSHCHCRSCRRAHAAPVVTWVSVAAEQIRMLAGKDKLVPYASSPGVRRSFCGTCGTHLLYVADFDPTKVFLPRAAFETELLVQASAHVNYAEHVPWLAFVDDLPRFDHFEDDGSSPPRLR